MKKIYYVMENDPKISNVIWPSFKPTLEEKHGEAGAKGAKGEDSAAKFLMDSKYFAEFNAVIKHEDAVHQLMGVDFTAVTTNGKVRFIDVKSGTSSICWDKEKNDWFITIRSDWFKNANKKTDDFMHVGTKGDVFAYYELNDMLDWFIDNQHLLEEKEYGTKLYKKHWPVHLIQSNLWKKRENLA